MVATDFGSASPPGRWCLVADAGWSQLPLSQLCKHNRDRLEGGGVADAAPGLILITPAISKAIIGSPMAALMPAPRRQALAGFELFLFDQAGDLIGHLAVKTFRPDGFYGHAFGRSCVAAWFDRVQFMARVDGPSIGLTNLTRPRRAAGFGRGFPPAAQCLAAWRASMGGTR